MWVRLTRKLADFLDGVDVSGFRVGDVFELSAVEGHRLIAERWAEPHMPSVVKAEFFKGSRSGRKVLREAQQVLERLWRFREEMDRKRFAAHERRRMEDRIRDELHDSRTITVRGGRVVR